MLDCKESDGTLQRTVSVTIKPTPTELADAIWNLYDAEQVTLLSCLKRRFCNNEAGLMQMAAISNKLSQVPEEKLEEVKAFVKCLADYILDEREDGK